MRAGPERDSMRAGLPDDRGPSAVLRGPDTGGPSAILRGPVSWMAGARARFYEGRSPEQQGPEGHATRAGPERNATRGGLPDGGGPSLML